MMKQQGKPENETADVLRRANARSYADDALWQPPVEALRELAATGKMSIGTHTNTGASATLEPDSANALQDFVNLPDDSDAVRAFQSKYPKLFPDAFWYAVLPGGKQLYEGSVIAGVTCTEPSTEQPALSTEQVLAFPPRWLWIEVRGLLRQAWRTSFADEIVAQILSVVIGDDGDYLSQSLARLADTKGRSALALFQPTTAFQLAILAMHRSPWRARFCGTCGRSFIADERNKNRRYCGTECSGAAREKSQLAYEDSGKRPARSPTQQVSPTKGKPAQKRARR